MDWQTTRRILEVIQAAERVDEEIRELNGHWLDATEEELKPFFAEATILEIKLQDLHRNTT